MSNSREGRSASPSGSVSPARGRRSRSLSRSQRSRSRSRSQDPVDEGNPGNNLYVTGLSTRVTNADLEKFFSREGKVLECHLVTDPRSQESRGFAFVTMETVKEADRCIKYLNSSVLEGRLVTVAKAKRKRGRTPTPGKYYGAKDRRGTLENHPWVCVEGMIADGLVTIHLADITAEIIPQGTGEEDQAHHIIG